MTKNSINTILERNGIVWSLEDEKLITINDLAIQLNMAIDTLKKHITRRLNKLEEGSLTIKGKLYYPDLMKEWDYEKNNVSGVLPSSLTDGIQIKAWWKCDKGHSYQASPYYRIKKQGGCPYCSHQKLLKGFNDLATLYPEVLSEWDNEKNGFSPNEIMAHTLKKVWWKCKSGHSYLMNTAGKTRGRGCPICAMATHTSFPEQAIYYYIKRVFSDAINAYRQFKQELDIYIPSIETAIEYDGWLTFCPYAWN